MSRLFIIDAHAHLGLAGRLPCPETTLTARLAMMDRLGIEAAICSDQEALAKGGTAGLEAVQRAYDASGGRILGQGVFDPRAADRCLGELRDAIGWPGFRGLKIHPSLHATPAEAAAYEPSWQFAAEHDLPILAHTWSTSAYNPVQALSTPERFEPFIQRFPTVRFVLGHAGGRGTGRAAAVQLANAYENVYVDFSGDIFCHRLIEHLAAAVSARKILFGSDFPWISPEAQLTRVLLAPISASDQAAILRRNAARVYKIEESPC